MKKIISAFLAGIMCLLCGCAADVSEEHELTDTNIPSATQEVKQLSEPVLLTKVTYPESAGADDHERRYELKEENKVPDDFKYDVNRFALKTAGSMIGTSEDPNFNYSPASLYFALAIAAGGAQGETQSEILELMELSNADEIKNVGTLYRLLYSDNEAFKLKIANSVWLDDSFTFKDSFISQAQDEHYAQIYTADLPQKETGEAIGKWISEHTLGTLEPKVELDTDTMLAIINTVYFNDKWISPFQEEMTQTGVFHAADKDIEAEFMMKSGKGSGIVKNDEYQKVSLGFASGAKMMFIMPTDGTDVRDLMKDADRLEEIIDEPGSAAGILHLSLPKFTFKTDIDVKKALLDMGIENMFSDSADFSGISDTPAYISQIKQGTYIALDEEGVEASAYTMMMASATALLSGEETLTFDKPFIYTIILDNVILFMGTVENPSQDQ